MGRRTQKAWTGQESVTDEALEHCEHRENKGSLKARRTWQVCVTVGGSETSSVERFG